MGFSSQTQMIADKWVSTVQTRSGPSSLQTLKATAQLAWFPDGSGTVSFAHYVQELARRRLKADGDGLIVHSNNDQEPHQSLEEWRWLTLALPADLLLAAFASLSSTSPKGPINLCPRTAKLLHGRPVAETHLHAGSAVSYPALWSSLMIDARSTNWETPKAPMCPLGDPATFRQLAVACAIARLFLARYLFGNRNQTNFEEYLDSTLPEFCVKARAHGTAAMEATIRNALNVLIQGSGVDWRRASSAYASLVGGKEDRAPRTLAELSKQDPLTSIIGSQEPLGALDTSLATAAIRYLANTGKSDLLLAKVFWQYQKVRNLVYRHVVLEPGTAGLDWFSKTFSRIKPMRNRLKYVMYQDAIRHVQSTGQVQAIELRRGPEKEEGESIEQIREFARQALTSAERCNMAPPEVALVLHFQKAERTNGMHQYLNAAPLRHSHGARFGRWFFEAEQQAKSVAGALRKCPELLVLLRGIDTAGCELSIPTWVTVGLFHYLRREVEALVSEWAGTEHSALIQPLHATYHAGEEFRSPVEGMRRMHELLEFGIIQRGDRIGHGLALGINIEDWVDKWDYVVQPREERLDDLLWLIDINDRNSLGLVNALAWVHEAATLGDEMYDTNQFSKHGVGNLIKARRLRHNPTELRQLGYPYCSNNIPPHCPIRQLLLRYLTSGEVFRRAQAVVPISSQKLGQELSDMLCVQHYLRKQVAVNRVTLEANPSSNLVIGQMWSFQNHPIVSEHQAFHTKRGVSVSINTDNPLTFASSVHEEFAYIHGALRSSVSCPRVAATHLASTQRAGWNSRFTHPDSCDIKVLRQIAGTK